VGANMTAVQAARDARADYVLALCGSLTGYNADDLNRIPYDNICVGACVEHLLSRIFTFHKW
jgi:hypothetical protein